MSEPRGAVHSRAVLELVEQIKPLFASKSPELQGAVIIELTSLWLAGHPKDVREDLLEINNVAIRGLTQINARMLGTEP